MLLQAGIALGMLLMAASGLIFFIGTPLLTYCISTYLAAKKQREYIANQHLVGNSNQKPTSIYQLKSFGWALLIMAVILIGLWTLPFLLRGDLG
jgi:hypothetical protein